MLKRSLALSLLIVSASLAFAQDPVPSGDAGTGSAADSGGGGSMIAPPSTGGNPATEPASTPGFDQGFNQGAQAQTPATTKTGTAPAEPDLPNFSLPGGYGSAPQTVVPGVGLYARPPIAFSTTLQQGYTDNVYSTSGKKGPDTVITIENPGVTFLPGVPFGITTPPQTIVIPAAEVNPVQGSLITQGSVGTQILLSASRIVMSLELNGGGSFYWDRRGNPFDPSGSANLLFAYKLTPRAQLSAVVSAAYLSQPDLSLLNGPTQSGLGNYINSTSRFDLSYQFTARLSTITTLTLNSQYFLNAAAQANNFLDSTLGESVRYALSPRIAAVVEVRTGQTRYTSSTGDSNSQYLLGGCDLTLTRRFSGSIRVGETYREYPVVNAPNSQSPFLESTVTYGYGKASTLEWTTRYGFEQNASSNTTSSNQSFRTGLNLNQVFSAKLIGSIGTSYTHEMDTPIIGAGPTVVQDTATAGFGAQYMLSRTITLFGNFNHSQVFAASINSYSVNQIFLGATCRF